MANQIVSQMPKLLYVFYKHKDLDAVETMLALLTNLIVQDKRYRQSLTEKGIVKLAILVAEKFKQDDQLFKCLKLLQHCAGPQNVCLD